MATATPPGGTGVGGGALRTGQGGPATTRRLEVRLSNKLVPAFQETREQDGRSGTDPWAFVAPKGISGGDYSPPPNW